MEKKDMKEIFDNCMSATQILTGGIDSNGDFINTFHKVEPKCIIRDFNSDSCIDVKESGIYDSNKTDREFTNFESAWAYIKDLDKVRIMDVSGQIWYDSYDVLKSKCISNTKEGNCEVCGKEALLDANNKDKKYVCESCWYKQGYDKMKYEVWLNGGINLATDDKDRAEASIKELKNKAKIINEDWLIELRVQK